MKKIKSLLSVFLAFTFIVSMVIAYSEDIQNLAFDKMTKETFISSDGTSLPYRLYVPDDYDSKKEYSFLVFLHGAGNRGDDNERQVVENTGLINRIIGGEEVIYNGEIVDTSNEFIIIAPQCATGKQWVDTPWNKKPDPSYSLDEIPQSQYLTSVTELINKMLKVYNINLDRMYLTGLSMGGFGTWDLLMRYPNLFAAAIPMGGAGDVSKANIIKSTPVWTFHQLQDPTVSADGTIAMVKALIDVGAEVKFTPYFDGVHNAWTKGYAETELLQWLYNHTKSTNKHDFTGEIITSDASDWAKDEVALAYASGILPQKLSVDYLKDITRQEFCEMIVNILPDNLEGSRHASFTDCQNESVRYAYSVGVINGLSDSIFAPHKKATREEIATMIYRAFKIISPNAKTNAYIDFNDKSKISEWAVDAIGFLNKNKIILGDEFGNVMPDKNTTVEEAVLLVYRAFCSANYYHEEDNTVHTGTKFTYWVPLPDAASQTLTSYNDLLMYKEIAKITGTEVEFIHPPASTGGGGHAFDILMASGEYPDMIEYAWGKYPGGPDQAIKDGVIIALNDYLEDYAPNYYDYMEGKKAKESNYIYKLMSVSDGGNYYGFKGINIGSYSGYSGLYVRKDLLDKLDLDIPETIDDWEHVFKIAKENGIKYPLTGNVSSVATFAQAWNITLDFFIDEGNVKFGPFESSCKDYLKKMNEWVNAGYIDPNYVTNSTSSIETNMTDGTSIASFGYIGSSLGKLLPAMAAKDPNYNLAACPFPVLKKGDIPIFQPIQAEVSDPSIAISARCGADDEERYKEAIQWCDFLYSGEGMILKAFGVKGNTYTIEKDAEGKEHYVYTDKIINHNSSGASSIEAALYHFMRPANAPGFNQHPDYLDGYYPYQQQKDAIRKWNEHVEVAKKHVMPSVTYTEHEASIIADIGKAPKKRLDAAIADIILGNISLDTYDDTVMRAKESGYNTLIEINQAAYDRYISLTK